MVPLSALIAYSSTIANHGKSVNKNYEFHNQGPIISRAKSFKELTR
jgi:hypothetical protein